MAVAAAGAGVAGLEAVVFVLAFAAVAGFVAVGAAAVGFAAVVFAAVFACELF